MAQLVETRQKSGGRSDDLLDTMLYGRDPVTGLGLTAENIRYQLVTFLIAGHEVSLSFKCWCRTDDIDYIRSAILLIPLPTTNSSSLSSAPRRGRCHLRFNSDQIRTTAETRIPRCCHEGSSKAQVYCTWNQCHAQTQGWSYWWEISDSKGSSCHDCLGYFTHRSQSLGGWCSRIPVSLIPWSLRYS